MSLTLRRSAVISVMRLSFKWTSTKMKDIFPCNGLVKSTCKAWHRRISISLSNGHSEWPEIILMFATSYLIPLKLCALAAFLHFGFSCQLVLDISPRFTSDKFTWFRSKKVSSTSSLPLIFLHQTVGQNISFRHLNKPWELERRMVCLSTTTGQSFSLF